MDTIDKVLEWHVTFGVPAPPVITLNPARVALRLKLLREELAELEAGLERGDVANVLQELTDLQYVLDGTFIEFGLDAYKEAAFAEVHRANMSKLDADGRPARRADGKILKGPNFRPADMGRVLACEAAE